MLLQFCNRKPELPRRKYAKICGRPDEIEAKVLIELFGFIEISCGNVCPSYKPVGATAACHGREAAERGRPPYVRYRGQTGHDTASSIRSRLTLSGY